MPTKTTRVSMTGVARGTTTARTAAERVNATSAAPRTKTMTSTTTMGRPSSRSDGLAGTRLELDDGVRDRLPRAPREVVAHARDHEQARARHCGGCRPSAARSHQRAGVTGERERARAHT